MNYVIKNCKNLYIKLDENGKPITCSEKEKLSCEYSKAKNILHNLPKILKRLNFYVEGIPEIMPSINKEVVEVIKKKVIQNDNYELSENVSRWIDRFGSCYDVLQDAKDTLKNLIEELDKTDKELLDLLHSIELESSKDMYNGWKIYTSIKENRKRRRIIKDEILIIKDVLEEINPSCLSRERVQKAIDGLFGRKYTFRIIEEEGTDNAM